MELSDLVFVGFNSRVAALHRDTGAIQWSWMAPKGRGYVAVFLDGNRLIVSIMGYTYCLHPLTGQQLWYNEMTGFGCGVTCIASVNGCTPLTLLQQSASDDEAAAQSSQTQHNTMNT